MSCPYYVYGVIEMETYTLISEVFTRKAEAIITRVKLSQFIDTELRIMEWRMTNETEN